MPPNIADIHRELSADMRWRRDTEFKLLTVHFAVIGASLALMFQAQEKGLSAQILAPLASMFVATSYWLVARKKVQKEHEVYRYLGERVVAIWDRWGLFDPVVDKEISGPPVLLAPSRNYGMGDGYKHILTLMWISWLASLIVALILLGRILVPCGC